MMWLLTLAHKLSTLVQLIMSTISFYVRRGVVALHLAILSRLKYPTDILDEAGESYKEKIRICNII